MFCKYCGKENKEDAKFCKYCGESLIIPSGATETSTEIVYGGFWIRVGAFVIDYALILIAAFILGIIYPSFFASLSFLNDEVLGFIMIIVYHVFFLSIFSSTPGKMLYKLMVIDEKTGAKVSFGKALARSSSYVLSSFVFGLGFLFIGFDKEKHRGWHDRIAKTLVIRKQKKSLILPIILSVIALCLSVYASYFLQKGYDFSDFSYLGKEGTIINSIQQKLSQQPSGFCCSDMPSSEIDYYLKEISLKLSSGEEQNAEQIFENFGKAVVIIGGNTKSGEFGFGSGFIISPSGLLVTNYHVIENMDKLAVALIKKGDTQLFDVNLIVAKDPLEDIAVLKIEGQNLPFITMGDSDLVKVGQTIFALGNPQGLVNTISGGMISQIRELEGGIKDFQITSPISEGSSGGALFNKNGEVIGITYAFYEAGQNLNLAIPINEVKDLLGLSLVNSETIPKDNSNSVWCNGQYWERCSTGQKFHCPQIGDPFCCDTGLICNDQCWSPCGYGYKFVCPTIGNAYCE
ncbi:MAG: hypothetical protein COX44_01310 [Candidatus Portnoybacteria bacterium CG23_combo_of_CG06-09_8_20_14_all_37_13]|uniref:RDD domain-containing protein n=1 Tax=Candidatus Portnoybacteria bacterium CG23_combo_of_CG06-09_8_20_14_all_37_13 TaxID=1974819 RepID=A0A2G9YD67_9BACT|nr:MAG: hypothetical protein COX44_01310 [Candidatus Portnoybacteria bacterium CG23_combo_of_CG06-09_8_20_14_all_37_13]